MRFIELVITIAIVLTAAAIAIVLLGAASLVVIAWWQPIATVALAVTFWVAADADRREMKRLQERWK